HEGPVPVPGGAPAPAADRTAARTREAAPGVPEAGRHHPWSDSRCRPLPRSTHSALGRTWATLLKRALHVARHSGGMPSASVEAVCVVHEIIDGYFHPTAIDKRAVDGSVRIGELGPEGDRHIDKAHGGPDAAVYVYAAEDAAYFARVLEREIPPGL